MSELPVLPYAGTSGHSGSETSEERVRIEDVNGATSMRQQMVLQWLSLRGDRGGTVHEFRLATNFHHGQASAALSNMHMAGKITRLKERRNKCQVYVLPLYVNGREEVAHRSNKVVPIDAVMQEALATAWDQGYATGYADEFGDQRKNPYKEG